jgi:hypothetical protein
MANVGSQASFGRPARRAGAGLQRQAGPYVPDIGSGETIGRRPDDVVPTASCIKLFVF